MSNKPVLTHRFNSTLALMKAARKYMTHLSRSNKRKSLDRYIHKMDSGMRVLVSHPAVFLLGWGLGGWSAGGGRVGFGFSARSRSEERRVGREGRGGRWEQQERGREER